MRVNNKVKKKLSGNQYKKHAREPLKSYAARGVRRGEKTDIRTEQKLDATALDSPDDDQTRAKVLKPQ